MEERANALLQCAFRRRCLQQHHLEVYTVLLSLVDSHALNV
jgi:hypothetical protein